jgi:ribosomal RNA-processing protein 1
MKIPNGLRYHIIDIYVDELDKVDTPRNRNLPIDVLLGPLRNLETESPTKAVRLKVKEALEDARLSDWNNQEQMEQRDENEEEWGGIDD